ncbi:MAG TPA: EAL domain-containing protein [Thermoanaerobaculia bacterium]
MSAIALQNYETHDRKQVILLLDDDGTITEGLAVALERSDRTLITCNDVESAEMALERFRPSVVVSDVHVSGEFGFEGLDFISFAKRALPGARVILMTGDAPDKLQLEASQRGAVAFLRKPFEANELEAVIDLMSPVEAAMKRLPARITMPLLDDILTSSQLGTAFQPIVDLHNSWEPIGYEALARYASDSPMRSPDLLFQYAGRKHRIADLETSCIKSALNKARTLTQSSMLFLNIHPDVLHRGTAFRDLLRDEAQRAGVPLNRVVLELTEQGSLGDDSRVFRLFDQLRNEGVRVAFDDVGVAYSHLPYIDRIRPEFLKISQNFGTAFEADPTRTKLVRNLVTLAHDFDCAVILEGIEEIATAQAATELGIKYGQGYLFGRPSDASVYTTKAM